jgi:hypothetical protein
VYSEYCFGPSDTIRVAIRCAVRIIYQNVATDGAQHHAAPNKKGNVGRRKTGGAGRQSVVPGARLGTVVG